MASKRERNSAEQSQTGNPPPEQPNATVAETNGTATATETAATKRRKRKGARTVFYMATQPWGDAGKRIEVARADTKHQLVRKLDVLRECNALDGSVDIIQCRPA